MIFELKIETINFYLLSINICKKEFEVPKINSVQVPEPFLDGFRGQYLVAGRELPELKLKMPVGTGWSVLSQVVPIQLNN